MSIVNNDFGGFMMKKKLFLQSIALLLSFTLVGCTANKVDDDSQTADTKTITDMAGREIVIPTVVDKVFSTEPIGTIFLYNIAPDKLLGWNFEPTESEKMLILDEYKDLPSYGMGNGINKEAVIAGGADMGIISFDVADENFLDTVETMQETLNIPIFAVSSNLLNTPESYRMLGECINEVEKGEELAKYSENIFSTIIEIPESDQKTVYFGNGVQSLETAPLGSVSSQEFDMLQIKNVAEIETNASNRVSISPEQIISWNPEIIILNGEPKEDLSEDSAVLEFVSNPSYKEITAVKNGEVYGVPKSPFSFISRPTGPNRLMGIEWLKTLVYPEFYSEDLSEVTKEFYSLFYHIDLTDEQVNELLHIGE